MDTLLVLQVVAINVVLSNGIYAVRMKLVVTNLQATLGVEKKILRILKAKLHWFYPPSPSPHPQPIKPSMPWIINLLGSQPTYNNNNTLQLLFWEGTEIFINKPDVAGAILQTA